MSANNSFESGMVAGILFTIFVVLIFQFGSWIGYYSCKSYVIENPNAVEKWKAENERPGRPMEP